MEDRTVLGLLDVCTYLENSIRKEFPSSVWLRAEISKLNLYEYSGHAYPELVEKKDGKIVAQIRSIIWKKDFMRINAKFIQVVRQPLKDGLSIVCRARLSYSALYGLSLIIEDIDPYVTLGNLEKERLECIEKLKAENLWNKNKEKHLTTLPQRLAIISLKTSKGYSDFIQTLSEQRPKFDFFYHLFPSILQGDGVSTQMIEALQTIEKVKEYFDCVLIIRGGGGDIGLSCYNDYFLCREIANFPLPVLTGIGHSTNETIAEMISFKNFITPTALGEFILEGFENFWNELKGMKEGIIKGSKRILETEKSKNSNIKQNIIKSSHICIEKENNKLSYSLKSMLLSSKNLLEKENNNLNLDKKLIKALDPKNILQKGYSITMINGEILTSISQVKSKDRILTKTIDGEFYSSVE